MTEQEKKLGEFLECFSKLYAEELSPGDIEDTAMDCMDILSAEDIAELVKRFKGAE